jgi:hypothetical protein
MAEYLSSIARRNIVAIYKSLFKNGRIKLVYVEK